MSPQGQERHSLLVGAGSWVAMFCWHTGNRQKENRKRGVLQTFKAHPKDILPLARLHLLKFFYLPPNSATYWRPGIEAQVPVGTLPIQPTTGGESVATVSCRATGAVAACHRLPIFLLRDSSETEPCVRCRDESWLMRWATVGAVLKEEAAVSVESPSLDKDSFFV